jgi:hypothetical protein
MFAARNKIERTLNIAWKYGVCDQVVGKYQDRFMPYRQRAA